MSNWICDKCGANYIDVSHQEPSVSKQELEIRELKRLLKECKPYISYSVNKKKYLGITPSEANLLTKIDEVLKND